MAETDVLLRLKRQYSKDETVAFLFQRLSEADVKNGVLVSEIAELKYKNNQLQSEMKKIKKLSASGDLHYHEVVGRLGDKIQKHCTRIRALMKDRDYWKAKFYNLSGGVEDNSPSQELN